MVLVIGEILFDDFPDYSRIGGAPFNFAYHLAMMGARVRFISRIGKDEKGRQITDFISQTPLRPEDLQIDPDHPTGRVQVTLDAAGVPVFVILPDMAYDYIETETINESTKTEQIDFIYFGTLIQRTETGFRNLHKILSERGKDTRTFCDINLRQNCYSAETVRSSLAQTDILKLSEEECDVIAGLLGLPSRRDAFIEHLFSSFGITTVILTRGSKGSAWFSRKVRESVQPPPLSQVVDTVGAGDAFAAAASLGILQGAAPDRILRAASSFAAAVCGIPGAVPDNQSFYAEIRKAYS